MNPTRITTVGLLIVLAAPPWSSSSPVEMTSDSLLGLLADELTAVLGSRKKCVPLPPTLTAVYASPKHLPCFAFSRNDSYAKEDLTTTLKHFGTEHDGFRLLAEGRVIGWGDQGEIVLTTIKGTQGAIWERGDPRPISVPMGTRLDRALRVGGQWVYQTPIGMITDDSYTPWPNSEDIPRGARIIVDAETVVIVFPYQATVSASGRPTPLTILQGDHDNFKREVYENLPFNGVHGVIRHREGQLIALGSKLAPLRHDFKPTPTEDELAEALQAAKSSGLRRRALLLGDLTLYPARSLSGLAGLLRELPDPTQHARELQRTIANTLGSLERLKNQPVPPDQEELAEALGPVLQRYLDDSQRALRDCVTVLADQIDFSVRTAGQLMVGGCQYYDGWWIQHPRVIFQRDLSEAFIRATVYDCVTGLSKGGIFRIDDHGRLHHLAEDSLPQDVAAVDTTLDPQGNLLLFYKEHGLAQLAGDRLTWIDRSEGIRQLGKMIGCDKLGRLYFHQARTSFAPKVGQFWVYQISGETSAPTRVAAYTTNGTAVLDDLDRLWFVSGRSTRSVPGHGFIHEPHYLTTAEQVELELEHGAESPDVSVTARGHTSPPTLCRLDSDGVLHRYYASDRLRGCKLLPGRHGAMLVASGNSIALIHGNAIYQAEDIHELAQRQFGLLLEVAPTKTPFRAHVEHRSHGPRPTWLAVGEILWVAYNDRVEAYRRGEALSIDQRLAVLGAWKRGTLLIGPLGSKQEPSVLIACDPSRLDMGFWAVQGAEGIALNRAGRPDAEQRDGYIICNPGTVSGLPVVDYRARCLYYHHGFDRMWKVSGPRQYTMFFDAGAPILVTRQGHVLVRRARRVFPGYRFVTDEDVADLAITYTKPLTPVHAEKDGRLLCMTPTGVAWLRSDAQGEFLLDESITADLPGQPQRFLGRTSRAVYLMTTQHEMVSIPIINQR